MGVPVICSDLPVFREILGDGAIFLNVNDADIWTETIQSVAQKTKNDLDTAGLAPKLKAIPRWESHFCHVFDDT